MEVRYFNPNIDGSWSCLVCGRDDFARPMVVIDQDTNTSVLHFQRFRLCSTCIYSAWESFNDLRLNGTPPVSREDQNDLPSTPKRVLRGH